MPEPIPNYDAWKLASPPEREAPDDDDALDDEQKEGDR